MRTKIFALLLLLLVVAAAPACGGDDEDAAATAVDTATTPEPVESTPSAESDTAPAEACTSVGAPVPKPDGGSEQPTALLDPTKTYSLVVTTNCGAFTVQLDQAIAPKTAASLVALARNGFFDGTTFHRVVPGFVIQGGDPTGTGTGGPGYSTVDVPPAGTAYTQGVVAMAKSGQETPGTAGSQFFVVTGADAGLPPDYAVVGKVTDGLDTVLRIDALGTGDAPPSQPVVIEEVTVEER